MGCLGEWERRFGTMTQTAAAQVLLVGVRDPNTLRRIVTTSAGPLAALDRDDWLPLRRTRDDVARALEAELTLMAKEGIWLVAPGHVDWPAGFATTWRPPLLGYVKGKLPDWSHRPGLALVGSRRGAAYGERVARRLATQWARLGGTVVSGGALGVDTAAHRVTLDEGGGTVAVLATGVDCPHPRSNRSLFHSICERGALFSELPTGTRPLPRNFPWRNRLIAGLSVAVVVVQAAAKSGALHTATFALKSGRKLFTVPSSLDDEACAGSLDLLVQGVPALAWTRQLNPLFAEAVGRESKRDEPVVGSSPCAVSLSDLEPHHQMVLEALQIGPQHVDDLAATTNLSQAELSLALLELELKDRVVREAGNHFACNVRLER